MSISVVIPLYNKAPHIKRTLQSVLSQTVLPDEIIVVDDGSTDGGGEIVKSLSVPGLRLIRQENQGVSAARNRGIAEAEGELIAFLDSDDAWKPRFLEVILQMCRDFPQAGAYATCFESITPNGVKDTFDRNILPPGINRGLITNYFGSLSRWPVWTSATVVPKRILVEIDGFPVGEALTEDLDLWFRIALRYPIAWSNEELAIYYQDATNRTIGSRRFTQEAIIARTIRSAIRAGLVPPEYVEDVREFAVLYQLFSARDCLTQGKKDLARQILDHARGTRKFAREWWKWRILAALPGNLGPRLWQVKQSMRHQG
jgi:glycosyltransferase involved in cell wall biosynthesis